MPNGVTDHPRGWHTDVSHQRKVKSYWVETEWYQNFSMLCSDFCKVPAFYGSFTEGDNHWIVMEDLQTHFPEIKTEISLFEVKVCLKWLANFHAQFMNTLPTGLWEVGTYWHLATRLEEFEKISDEEVKAKAHIIDQKLNNCQFKTIVHGDAKLANFCFSENGQKVAAVDFQYVGGGCGMKDVAYFLGSCLISDDCERHELELLDYYFLQLRTALHLSDKNLDSNKLEQEWRQLYPLASADFTRFLLGWMPSHQKVNTYSLNLMKSVLSIL